MGRKPVTWSKRQVDPEFHRVSTSCTLLKASRPLWPPEIKAYADWCQEQVGWPEVNWGYLSYGRFWFKDDRMATLFLLTWQGQVPGKPG